MSAVSAIVVPQLSSEDRAQLARQLASQLGDAECAGTGSWWSAAENGYIRAQTTSDAIAAAAPALALCARCKAVQACQLRAVADRYTGLAAGTVWKLGRPRPLTERRRLGKAS